MLGRGGDSGHDSTPSQRPPYLRFCPLAPSVAAPRRMGGFPSVQVMQSAGRCYRSWARRRLGHGLSVPNAWVRRLCVPQGGGSPAGGGPRAAPCQLGFCNLRLQHCRRIADGVADITKQARAASALTCAFTGGGEGSRTPDTGIFSPLLYQLSYPAKGLLLQARLLYQTRRKGQRESLQCRENHRVEPR